MSLKERLEMARQLGRQIGGERSLKETLEELASLGGDKEAIMKAFCEAVEEAVDRQEMLDQLKITPPKKGKG